MECCRHISRHRQVEGAGIIIPVEGNATVTFALPIHTDFIVSLEALQEMVSVFLSDEADAEIIHDQAEKDWSCVVFP